MFRVREGYERAARGPSRAASIQDSWPEPRSRARGRRPRRSGGLARGPAAPRQHASLAAAERVAAARAGDRGAPVRGDVRRRSLPETSPRGIRRRASWETAMAQCDYANARVRAMKGRLLGPNGITELLAQPGLDGPARLPEEDGLRRGRGRPPREGSRILSARAERGLRMRLARRPRSGSTASSAASASAPCSGRCWPSRTGGTSRRSSEASAGEKPPERIFLLLAPTPELDDAALGELVRQKEVKAVVDLLATWRSPLRLASDSRRSRAIRTHRELFLLEAGPRPVPVRPGPARGAGRRRGRPDPAGSSSRPRSTSPTPGPCSSGPTAREARTSSSPADGS